MGLNNCTRWQEVSVKQGYRRGGTTILGWHTRLKSCGCRELSKVNVYAQRPKICPTPLLSRKPFGSFNVFFIFFQTLNLLCVFVTSAMHFSLGRLLRWLAWSSMCSCWLGYYIKTLWTKLWRWRRQLLRYQKNWELFLVLHWNTSEMTCCCKFCLQKIAEKSHTEESTYVEPRFKVHLL